MAQVEFLLRSRGSLDNEHPKAASAAVQGTRRCWAASHPFGYIGLRTRGGLPDNCHLPANENIKVLTIAATGGRTNRTGLMRMCHIGAKPQMIVQDLVRGIWTAGFCRSSCPDLYMSVAQEACGAAAGLPEEGIAVPFLNLSPALSSTAASMLSCFFASWTNNQEPCSCNESSALRY